MRQPIAALSFVLRRQLTALLHRLSLHFAQSLLTSRTICVIVSMATEAPQSVGRRGATPIGLVASDGKDVRQACGRHIVAPWYGQR